MCAGSVRAGEGADASELSRRANASLNLVDSVVFRAAIPVDYDASDASPLSITVPIQGLPRTLELSFHSVRSKGYAVYVQRADGSYGTIEPGPVRTLRGSVVGMDDSAVAATISDDGLSAAILVDHGAKYWIEPIAGRVAGAGAGDHAIYRDDDALDPAGDCLLSRADPPPGLVAPAYVPGAIAGSGVLQIAELAADTDVEFYDDLGSVDAVEARINAIINTMNVQYERDVMIRHVITTIIVRATEPDPFTSSDPDTLLSQLRENWETEHAGLPRDIVQLFTGKNLTGSTIGVAWLGTPWTSTVCGSWGYSVVESNCFGCSSFAAKTDISAHELGHNWGADHCACSGWTMNPSITSANRFHPTESIPDIELFRDSEMRTCLDESDELRRVIVSADRTTVGEGEAIPLTATATFRFGPDRDVTAEATWSVEPAGAGAIDADGYFTAPLVDGDACATVSAAYTFDGVTRSGSLRMTIVDIAAPLAVVFAEPPREAIDVRQPKTFDGSAALGWDRLDIVLNGQLCQPSRTDFIVTQEGGLDDPPIVIDLLQTGETTFRLTLSHPIEPGAWTTITHLPSGFSIRLGYLPADVNNDGTSDTDDILALMDALEGVTQPIPDWSYDVDRSTVTTPGDLLSAIDLLIGADGERAWLGESLP
jgi:hypothetical protein